MSTAASLPKGSSTSNSRRNNSSRSAQKPKIAPRPRRTGVPAPPSKQSGDEAPFDELQTKQPRSENRLSGEAREFGVMSVNSNDPTLSSNSVASKHKSTYMKSMLDKFNPIEENAEQLISNTTSSQPKSSIGHRAKADQLMLDHEVPHVGHLQGDSGESRITICDRSDADEKREVVTRSAKYANCVELLTAQLTESHIRQSLGPYSARPRPTSGADYPSTNRDSLLSETNVKQKQILSENDLGVSNYSVDDVETRAFASDVVNNNTAQHSKLCCSKTVGESAVFSRGEHTASGDKAVARRTLLAQGEDELDTVVRQAGDSEDELEAVVKAGDAGVSGDSDSWEDEEDSYGVGATVVETPRVKHLDSCCISSSAKKSKKTSFGRRSSTGKSGNRPIVCQRTGGIYYENSSASILSEQENKSPLMEQRNTSFPLTHPLPALDDELTPSADDCAPSFDLPSPDAPPVRPPPRARSQAPTAVDGPPLAPVPRSALRRSSDEKLSLSVAAPALPERSVLSSRSTRPTVELPGALPRRAPNLGVDAPPLLLPRKQSIASSPTPLASPSVKLSARRVPPPVPPGGASVLDSPLPVEGTEFFSPPVPPRGGATSSSVGNKGRRYGDAVVTPAVRAMGLAPLLLPSASSLNDLRPGGEKRGEGAGLSQAVPVSGLDDSYDDMPASPSHSEGYLRFSSASIGYLPMNSQNHRGSSQTPRSRSPPLLPFSLPSDNNIYVGSDMSPPSELPSARRREGPRGSLVALGVPGWTGESPALHHAASVPNGMRMGARRAQLGRSVERLERVVPLDIDSLADSASDSSSIYHSHSSLYDDEPLYQIYHRGAVVRDVIQQDAGDDLECQYASQDEYMERLKMSATDILQRRTLTARAAGSTGSEPEPTSALDALSSLESASRTDPSFKKLWCEMAKVTDSGILNHMSMDERRLQESMFEIISSEASYLKSLNLLVGHFMGSFSLLLSKDKDAVLSRQDFVWLFSNSKAVRDTSIKTREALERLWVGGCVLNPVELCDEMADVAKQHYSVYVTYCSNAAYQERKYKELVEKSPEFAYMVRKLESVADCRSLPLSSFLALPMQRITRLPLLINAVRQRMKPYDASSPQVLRCIGILQKIVKQCNDGAKKMLNLEQMNELSTILEFKQIKKIPVVSESRHLVKKGALIHITKQTSGFLKKSKKSLFFFLFNDLLIITKKKSERQYEVVDHSPRQNVHAQVLDEDDCQRMLPPGGAPPGCRNLFLLALMDQRVEFILACSSLNEQKRWVQAFTPPEDLEGDEKIYESWDCPQVQTIRQYIAVEPDELSLEESDVINVHHKCSDGWYEGERIRDGEKGWFPVSHTVEIQNAHVRARNLRQQYRLMSKTPYGSYGQSSV